MTNLKALTLVTAYYAETEDEEGLGQEFSLYEDLIQMGLDYSQMVLGDPESFSSDLVALAEEF
tara:strand:- start:233 stop:421 length:189 start_codon:yes stop_codon:yes gene_type:complete